MSTMVSLLTENGQETILVIWPIVNAQQVEHSNPSFFHSNDPDSLLHFL